MPDEDCIKRLHRRHEVITSLISGAFAGAIAKTVIAPLDRTKINFQIRDDKKYSFKKALKFVKVCARDHGVAALWRGNSATMVRIAPYAAIQFASHEQYKNLLLRENESHLSPGRRYLAGSLAGLTSSSTTYPLDLARARMAVTDAHKYGNLWQVFKQIYRQEGIKTLYKGYIPTLLGVIPYAGTSFFTYESLKNWHSDKYENKDISAFTRLLFGACAGLSGQTSSYPLDIVRRRMQTAGITGKEYEYRSIFSTIRFIYTNEGIIHGFYKGLSMNWIKGPIAAGVSFSCFDLINLSIRNVQFLKNL